MEFKQHLNIFGTNDEYKGAEATMNVPAVSLVEDSLTIAYKPKLSIPNFDPRYLYEDLTTSTKYNASKRVIGIEVVPASHTPNKKARFMSVVNMSLDTPNTGTTDPEAGRGIKWGEWNVEVNNLEMFDSIGYLNNQALDGEGWDSDITDELKVVDRWGSIPVDASYFIDTIRSNPEILKGLGVESIEQFEMLLSMTKQTGILDQYWLYTIPIMGQDCPLMPSPFLSVTTKNPLYFDTRTCTSDVDGKSNTDKIIAMILEQNMETINSTSTGTIPNQEEYYPAALACHKFNAGVSSLSGKWYLPAIGELGYVCALEGRLNKKLSVLPKNMGICIGDIMTADTLGQWLWSSTQHSSYHAWILYTYDGYVGNANKDGSYDFSRVRAFLQEP